MTRLRHILTALAAYLPCRPPATEAVPAAVCDCMIRAADDARRWDEGLWRAIKRYGVFYSPDIGNC